MKKHSKMFIAGVAAAFVIVVIVASIFAVGGGNKEYDTHLEMAQKYLEELDYEQAIVELRMAIEIEPKDSEAYFVLAEVYVTMGDYESAIAALEEGYAAGGDAELMAEREKIAREYAELQERKEQEQQAEEFYEKYVELVTFARNEVNADLWGLYCKYLTFSEREQAYGGLAEQLEQYLADLDGTKGLSEELYDAGKDYYDVGNNIYFTKIAAYRYLADTYLYMGKLDECLRVRTEWAEFCDRPDLVQDGNRGYYEADYAVCASEYDRYGRETSSLYGSGDQQFTYKYIYEESHSGTTHWTGIGPAGLYEVDITYDSEGRILHEHQVNTRENEGITVIDSDYAYTGNHSFVQTMTSIYPNGHTSDPGQFEEQFYDEYGREIAH